MSDALLTERSFADIIAQNGGRVFRVGGCVRDMYLGITPKDIDLCVVGMVKKNFKDIFPHAEDAGKSFPVFRLNIDGVKCEVAFARTERKVSSGHKGFKVSSKPKITIEEDLYRRDLTVNSIAIDSLTGRVIDPYNGIKDIKDRVLRATSPHFIEDPVRALRVAGQSARLDFHIDKETLEMAKKVADELDAEPVERVFAEFSKVLLEANQPSGFFKALLAMELLEITFPEIAELDSEHFNKTMVNLDAVAKVTANPKLRFVAMGLVIGEEQLSRWNKRMTLPGGWLEATAAAIKAIELLKLPSPENLVSSIYSLSRGSLNVEEFDTVAEGIGISLPSLTFLKAKMHQMADGTFPKTLKGKELGEWLRRKHIELIAE